MQSDCACVVETHFSLLGLLLQKRHEILQKGLPKYSQFVEKAIAACEKRSSGKEMRKVTKKGHASHTRKTVPGCVGPLKQEKTIHQTLRKQDIASNTPWRA